MEDELLAVIIVSSAVLTIVVLGFLAYLLYRLCKNRRATDGTSRNGALDNDVESQGTFAAVNAASSDYPINRNPFEDLEQQYRQRRQDIWRQPLTGQRQNLQPQRASQRQQSRRQQIDIEKQVDTEHQQASTQQTEQERRIIQQQQYWQQQKDQLKRTIQCQTEQQQQFRQQEQTVIPQSTERKQRNILPQTEWQREVIQQQQQMFQFWHENEQRRRQEQTLQWTDRHLEAKNTRKQEIRQVKPSIFNIQQSRKPETEVNPSIFTVEQSRRQETHVKPSTFTAQQSQRPETGQVKPFIFTFEQSPARQKVYKELDLHTFTLKEAMTFFKFFLGESIEEYKKNSYRRQDRFIEVITGRGKHSPNGVPVIKPAVENYLIKHNYTFTWSNPGKVRIDLMTVKDDD